MPSVRYNYHDSFGSHTTPNLGVTYFINKKSRFKANYGSAYRAPSVDELYGELNHMGMFTMYGNPDLKPEKSRGYEFTYEQDFSDNSTARVTYFKQKKEDAINYQGSMAQGYHFYNIDEASYEGVEFEVKHQLKHGFQISGSYNWLDARDESDDSRIENTARSTYLLKLQWTDPGNSGWGVTAWNKWVSDYAIDSTSFGSVNTFNLVVNKRWGDQYRAYIGIDNMFNKDYADLYAYGRLWRAGFEMTF